MRSRPLWFKLNFLSSFPNAQDQMASDVLGGFLPASIAWLFSTGHSNEKPHNLFRGHPPEKTSSRSWYEIAGWPGHILGTMNVLNYFASIWGLTKEQKLLTRNLPPPTLKYVLYNREIFLVLMPLHKLSTYCIFFFHSSLMYLKGFSSLNKKPQLQMCLKQKPLNIWSSVQNS